ncbi:MAG: methionine--tRNA ligase [Bacteroidetes bacterium]|nr:methionine--tRNA ligase [Bacteroidota bacterium]
MEKKIYITTPLYYINASPHIGHAYTTIAADVYARYFKLRGKDVFFLTGTDEHGQKIEEAAKEAGKAPKDFADEVVEKYQDLWEHLKIEYNKFIRTTDDEHKKTVQKIIENMYEKGDIYKGEYEGLYCIPCESFCLETDLLDKDSKLCPDCGREIQVVKEESYFFKLSKYADKLLNHFNQNPDFLAPKFRASEMINFIKGGLKDLSISRTAVDWGIKFPLNNEHSVYVWFDALINYVSGVGYLGDKALFNNTWPCDLHFVGKEIYKFHTIIWSAMLLSLDLQLPKKVFGHGWWTFEGEKMSKSKGNVVDPYKVIDDYGADALRFFVLREVPFGNDGDFCMHNFTEKYNNELANELGNLFSRSLKMVSKYCNHKVPVVEIKENILKEKSQEVINEFEREIEAVHFSKALNKLWELVRFTNKYIEDEAPWKLAKDDLNAVYLEEVLFNILATMRVIALLVSPFMPESSDRMLRQLGITEDKHIDILWKELPQNISIGEISVLFPKIDI